MSSKGGSFSVLILQLQDQQCETADQHGGVSCRQLGVTSQGYVYRTDSEYAKMGVQGMTIMAASGDAGMKNREYTCIAKLIRRNRCSRQGQHEMQIDFDSAV